MFRKILPWIAVFFTVMLDTSVIPFLTSGWATPLISACAVSSLALLLGRRRGALLGLMAGLLMDILVNAPYGLMTLLMVLAGLGCGVAGRKFLNNTWTSVVAPGAMFALMEIVVYVYQTLVTSSVSLTLLWQAGVRVLIEVLVTQAFYLLFDWLLKPKLSRYTA